MGGLTKRRESESRRQAEQATCERGQVRVGTRFALMRTKYHICQQLAVESGSLSVNTDALLGEASRDARLCAGSKTIPECGGTFRVRSQS